mgnify:CR=1 FL=1
MKKMPAFFSCLFLAAVALSLAQEAPVPLTPAVPPPQAAPAPAQPRAETPPSALSGAPPAALAGGTVPSLSRSFPIPQDVKKEIDRIFSISPSERARACWNLGRFGSRAVHAVPFLLAMTADGNVAWFSSDGWGRWTTPGTEAAYALGRIGEPAREPALLLLSSSNTAMRMNGALALGEIGNPSACAAVAALLKDPEWTVREQAAVALGKMKDASAIEPLTAALKDSEWQVRKAALSALAALGGGKAAVEALLSTLDDSFPHIRDAAAAALRELTGQDFGADRTAWAKWWQEHGHSM